MISKVDKQVAAVILGIVALGVLLTWWHASSVTNVHKAEEYNRQSANANAISVQAETNANVTATQIEAVEVQRQSAKRDAQTARAAKDQAEVNRNKRKVEYENFRKKGVVVSNDDLDARERQLIADFYKLYPTE